MIIPYRGEVCETKNINEEKFNKYQAILTENIIIQFQERKIYEKGSFNGNYLYRNEKDIYESIYVSASHWGFSLLTFK